MKLNLTCGCIGKHAFSCSSGRADKWDRRFLELAEHVAMWSKDPSTKVGAVIVRPDRTIASLGYNGFPRGIEDRPEWLEDREQKYPRIVHAEMNAILSARERLDGCTLYTWPPSYGPTCSACAVHVIQAGITRVVGRFAQGDRADRWRASCELALQLYRDANITVEMIDE